MNKLLQLAIFFIFINSVYAKELALFGVYYNYGNAVVGCNELTVNDEYIEVTKSNEYTTLIIELKKQCRIVNRQKESTCFWKKSCEGFNLGCRYRQSEQFYQSGLKELGYIWQTLEEQTAIMTTWINLEWAQENNKSQSRESIINNHKEHCALLGGEILLR